MNEQNRPSFDTATPQGRLNSLIAGSFCTRSSFGICYSVATMLHRENPENMSMAEEHLRTKAMQAWLDEQEREWLARSANYMLRHYVIGYPVSAPRSKLNTATQYHRAAQVSGGMWKGAYGNARRKYYAFLIRQAVKEVAAAAEINAINVTNGAQ